MDRGNCRLGQRQERIDDDWPDKPFLNHIRLRRQPQQVYMAWLPGGPKSGQEILFDASASHDDDGGIVAYAWDFADGSTATGINARHSFRASGRYPVTLTVTDNMGLPNSSVATTAMVDVNQPPEPAIAAPAAA